MLRHTLQIKTRGGEYHMDIDTDMYYHTKYKQAADTCYEILRGCGGLPVSKLQSLIQYAGKRNLSFILKDDGRFIRKHNSCSVGVWEIKECC